MIDIFLSRPTWVASEFEEGLNCFMNFMKSHDLNPRTLGVNDYPIETPLDEVIGLMKKCNGAIILGYPQLKVTSGILKDNEIEGELLLPTEWNHIEAALAYAKGLPVLLIHHQKIKRGVFDRGAVNSFLYEIDLSKPSWPLTDRVSGALTSWLPKVKAYQNGNRVDTKTPLVHTQEKNIHYEKPFYWLSANNKKDGPFCQQCYDNDSKLIRLQDNRNGIWTCTTCKNHFDDGSYRDPSPQGGSNGWDAFT